MTVPPHQLRRSAQGGVSRTAVQMIQTLDPIRILTLAYWVISWRYTAMTNRRRRLSNRKTVAEHSYTVFFEPAAEGGYVVTCPALPGLGTEGDTLEEDK